VDCTTFVRLGCAAVAHELVAASYNAQDSLGIVLPTIAQQAGSEQATSWCSVPFRRQQAHIACIRPVTLLTASSGHAHSQVVHYPLCPTALWGGVWSRARDHVGKGTGVRSSSPRVNEGYALLPIVDCSLGLRQKIVLLFIPSPTATMGLPVPDTFRALARSQHALLSQPDMDGEQARNIHTYIHCTTGGLWVRYLAGRSAFLEIAAI